MSEQIIFKSQTFGGFNKDDVLEYIDLLNAEHTKALEFATNEIGSISSELSEKRVALEDSQKSFDELMTAYNELREHFLTLKERTANLESENDKLREKLTETEKELVIEKEVHEQLEEKVEKVNRENTERENAQKKALAEIANMGDSAKSMLNNAKNGAQSIINEAQASANGINTEIDGFCAEVEKTKEFMKDSLSVLIQRLEYIERTASGSKIIGGNGSNAISEIQSEYEKLVSEADDKSNSIKNRFFL